jgi:hypothetical protein
VYGRTADGDGRIVIYSKRPFAVAFFPPVTLDAATVYACERSRTCDVYHLVNMVSPLAIPDIRRRMGRGRETELQSVVALFCESDTDTADQPQHEYPTQAVAMAALAAMPLSPSIVNLSGRDDGGFHVYWLLDAPVNVTDDPARRRVKAISKAWQAKLKSVLTPYRLDSTFDLVRVLRIPGCINHKYEAVMTRPILVQDHRYRLDKFARHIDSGKSAPLRTATIHDVNHADRVQRCRRYLEKVPDALSGNHGHDKTFRVACECFRFGLSVDDARGVMQWFNKTKTGDEPWSEQDLEHKLQGAYETTEQQGQMGWRLRRSRR